MRKLSQAGASFIFAWMAIHGVQANADAESDQLQRQKSELEAQKKSLDSQLSKLQKDEAGLATQQKQLQSQLNSRQGDLNQAKTQLSRNQASLATAKAKESTAKRELSSAQDEQKHAEAAAREAEGQVASATTQVSGLTQQVANLQKTEKDLQDQANQQQQDLGDANAALPRLREELSKARDGTVAESDPARQIVAQAGSLRGAGRVCSGFETFSGQVQTALHCIAGLDGAAVATIRFFDGSGRVAPVTGILSRDPAHDVAVLAVSGRGVAASLVGIALTGHPVHLLALETGSDAVTISAECQILGIDLMSGAIRHDCPSAPGSSGGVLVQDGYVVAMHLGSLPEGKLAVAFDSIGRRPLPSALTESLRPEYNCDSDCRAEAYDSIPFPCPTLTNPGRTCHKDVFDPVKASACLTARESDCGARAASAALMRLKASLRSDIHDLQGTVHDLTGKIQAEGGKLTNIRGAVTTVQKSLAGVQKTLTSTRDAVASSATQAAKSVAAATDLSHAASVAKGVTKAALARRDAAVAKATQLGNQIKTATAEIPKAAARIDVARKAVETAGKDVAKAKDRVVAATHAVAGEKIAKTLAQVERDARHVAGDVAREARIPAAVDFVKVAKDLGGRAGHAIEAVGNGVSKTLDKFGKWVKQAEHDGLADLHGDAHHSQPPTLNDLPELLRHADNVNVMTVCFERAKARTEAYQGTLKKLNLLNISKNPSAISLPQLSQANEELLHHVLALSAGLAEVMQNHCDHAAIDGPIREALTDATQWQEWVEGVRRQRLFGEEEGQ